VTLSNGFFEIIENILVGYGAIIALAGECSMPALSRYL